MPQERPKKRQKDQKKKKKPVITNAGKDAQKVDHFIHFQQFGKFFKNYIFNNHTTQQLYSWAFIPEKWKLRSKGKWLNKSISSTQQLKKDELLIHLTTWMNFQRIMLSGGKKKKKTKRWQTVYKWSHVCNIFENIKSRKWRTNVFVPEIKGMERK